LRLLQKGSTVNLKDFKSESGLIEGLLRFDTDFKLKLEPKKIANTSIKNDLSCPKCLKGKILKGNMAYGCSDYKLGCNFKVPFDIVRSKLKDQKPTKELVYQILKRMHSPFEIID
jgi:DNA topoisomerase-3